MKRSWFVLVSLVAVVAMLLGACTPVAQAPSKVRVALILPSGKDDMSWSQGMYEGVIAVQNAMGADKMDVSVSENLFKLPDAGAAIRDYASQGYDLVIAHGSQFQNTIMDIAKEFPNVSFAYGTAFETAPNVFAYDPQAQQGAYVMGIIAATLTKSKIVGIVGPVEAGDAIKYNVGFKAGVAATDPSVKVLESYTGSFGDTVKAKEMASAHIGAGADILTGTAQQTVGAIQAAAEKPGVYWLSNDMDQSSLAPDTVLVAQAYQWQDVVQYMLDARTAGTKGGEHLTLDLANGRIKLVLNQKLAGVIPADLQAKMDSTEKDIAAGTLVVPLPAQ